VEWDIEFVRRQCQVYLARAVISVAHCRLRLSSSSGVRRRKHPPFNRAEWMCAFPLWWLDSVSGLVLVPSGGPEWSKLFVWSLSRTWFAWTTVDLFVSPDGSLIFIVVCVVASSLSARSPSPCFPLVSVGVFSKSDRFARWSGCFRARPATSSVFYSSSSSVGHWSLFAHHAWFTVSDGYSSSSFFTSWPGVPVAW
jgi:hypothetical protein